MPKGGIGGLLRQAGVQVDSAQGVLDRLPPVKHDRAEETQICGRQWPAVHRRLAGSGLGAVIWVLNLRDAECRAGGHRQRDADQAFVQKQAVCRATSLECRNIVTRAVGPVHLGKYWIQSLAGVEARLEIGRRDAPGIAGNMATGTSAAVRSETLKERVCLIDAA